MPRPNIEVDIEVDDLDFLSIVPESDAGYSDEAAECDEDDDDDPYEYEDGGGV